MKTLIDKINHFEQKTDGTVLAFNSVFSAKLEGICPSLEVEIGELADSDTTRWLSIGTLLVKHNFKPPTLEVEYSYEASTFVNAEGKTIDRKAHTKRRMGIRK